MICALLLGVVMRFAQLDLVFICDFLCSMGTGLGFCLGVEFCARVASVVLHIGFFVKLFLIDVLLNMRIDR